MQARELRQPAESLPAELTQPSYARGLKWQIGAEMRRQEARGDVQVGWRYARQVAPGVIEIPYVRRRTRAEVRRRRALRVAGAAVLVAGALLSLAAALWHARFVIMSVAGVALLLWSGWLITRLLGHRPGCVGLHCPGCKG